MSFRLKWLRMQQRSGWPFGAGVTILWVFGSPFLMVCMVWALGELVHALENAGVRF